MLILKLHMERLLDVTLRLDYRESVKSDRAGLRQHNLALAVDRQT